jgi:hypothetical protein
MVYSTDEVQTFTHWNRFSLSQHLAIESKAGPTVTPIMLEIMARRLTTQQQQKKTKTNGWLIPVQCKTNMFYHPHVSFLPNYLLSRFCC